VPKHALLFFIASVGLDQLIVAFAAAAGGRWAVWSELNDNTLPVPASGSKDCANAGVAMMLAVIATIVMSFFIALLLGCIDLHLFEVCAASGCTLEMGRRPRRATKLAFRKLNSISSKQIGEPTRSHRLQSFKTLNSV
jgi:hypothetical protein